MSSTFRSLLVSGEVRRSKKKAILKQKKNACHECRDGHRFCAFYKLMMAVLFSGTCICILRKALATCSYYGLAEMLIFWYNSQV